MGDRSEGTAGGMKLESSSAAPFDTSIAARTTELAPLRAALRRWLGAARISQIDADDILVAVGEACANAIEHGYGFRGDQRVTIRLSLRAGWLEAQIVDSGGWVDPPADPRTRGRGRMLMNTLMDAAEIDGGPGGTSVRLGKRVAGG